MTSGHSAMQANVLCSRKTRQNWKAVSPALMLALFPVVRWECAAGHRWEALPRSVGGRRGTWCPVCFRLRRRDTLESMQRIAAERGGCCLSASYVNGTTRLVWACSSGHTWEAIPAAVKRGCWCPVCAKGRYPTLDTMHEAARQHGGECLSKRYVNNVTPLRWRCSSGHEWKATPFSVLQGTWCRQCYWDSLRGSLAQMQAIAASRGGRCLSERYLDYQTKLTWECHRGHTWQATPQSIKRHWCPECAWLARSTKRKTRRKYEAVAAPDIPPASRLKNRSV